VPADIAATGVMLEMTKINTNLRIDCEGCLLLGGIGFMAFPLSYKNHKFSLSSGTGLGGEPAHKMA
jgi:hypothetical protein